MISKLLSSPYVFDLQQRFCNDYDTVKCEFHEWTSRRDVSILDVGCSTGVCGQNIFDVTNNSYVGIDITPQYIDYAKNKYKFGDYLVMDGTNLKFLDDKFDIVSFIGVLHHMDDATAVACIKEAHRVLKPSGVLLIAEPIFTANRLRSNILLSLDRGKYIRESQKYLDLADGLKILRTKTFQFPPHNFCSIVAVK